MAQRPAKGLFALDRAGLVAAGSIAVALAVMALKYLAYLMTGSVALYSDALESIVNLVTAITALVAIQVSAQPADKNHPFGHSKAEYLSAVIEGALIIVAALLIFREAYDALAAPRTLTDTGPRLAFNGARNGAQRRLVVVPDQPRARRGAHRRSSLTAGTSSPTSSPRSACSPASSSRRSPALDARSAPRTRRCGLHPVDRLQDHGVVDERAHGRVGGIGDRRAAFARPYEMPGTGRSKPTTSEPGMRDG